MPLSWDEIAHDALEKPDQPIQADATEITKYGAPVVAVVTAVITGILGAAWKVNPNEPAVLFGTAIIVAAVVLGIYFAFASDVRTRGRVTIARFNAISTLAVSPVTNGSVPDSNPGASDTDTALKSAEAKLTKAAADLGAAAKQMEATETKLDAIRRDLVEATKAMQEARNHE